MARTAPVGLAPDPRTTNLLCMAGAHDPGGNKRILLVDDDADLRESLAEALEEAGYTVDRAGNGQEALQKLRSHTGSERPLAVLLDLLMPVMNGWQFCQLKRRDPAVADIPVIAMSGAVSRDPQSPYFIEVEDFLAKPVQFEDLLHKLQAVTVAARQRPVLVG
jgi:CheY-like chemotaxis protein